MRSAAFWVALVVFYVVSYRWFAGGNSMFPVAFAVAFVFFNDTHSEVNARGYSSKQ